MTRTHRFVATGRTKRNIVAGINAIATVAAVALLAATGCTSADLPPGLNQDVGADGTFLDTGGDVPVDTADTADTAQPDTPLGSDTTPDSVADIAVTDAVEDATVGDVAATDVAATDAAATDLGPDALDPQGCLTWNGASQWCGLGSDSAVCDFVASCKSSTAGQCKIDCEMTTSIACVTESDLQCVEAALAGNDCTALAACTAFAW